MPDDTPDVMGPGSTAAATAPPSAPAPPVEQPAQPDITYGPGSGERPESAQPGTPPPSPDLSAKTAAMSDVVQHSRLGRAVRSLFTGMHNEYQVDPKTGKTVAVAVKDAPGTMFRNILAGAMLGGTIGSEHPERGFAGGFTAGGAAVGQKLENRDEMRRKQAQEEFKQQQEAARGQREEKSFDTEQQVRLANIAHLNAATARENQLMAGESFSQHEKAATAGKTQLQPYMDAGVNFAFSDVPESEMMNIVKNNPDAKNYQWEPTGTRFVMGADGKPNYEFTYSAVDPHVRVKMTPALIKLYKDAGMDKVYPQLSEVLKPGRELEGSQMVALNQNYQNLANQQYERQKQGLDIEHKKADIAYKKAETNKIWTAEAKDKAADSAWKKYNEKGAESLTPAERAVVLKELHSISGDLTSQLRVLHDPNDPTANQAEKSNILRNLESINSVINDMIPKGKTAPVAGGADPVVTRALNAIKGMSPDQQKAAINGSRTMTPAQKTAALAEVDKQNPPAAPLNVPEDKGTVTGPIVPVGFLK